MNAGHLSRYELINRDTLKFLWERLNFWIEAVKNRRVLSYIIFLIITIPFIIIMSFFVINYITNIFIWFLLRGNIKVKLQCHDFFRTIEIHIIK